ncbi:MAG: LexA family protein [Candidatus Dojkabacteria bacterium]
MSAVGFHVPATVGFASPAEDVIDKGLDLNELLVKRPQATFFMRVSGSGMIGKGINAGDILVVDRSLAIEKENIIVACMDGEMVIKHIRKRLGQLELLSDRSGRTAIRVDTLNDFELWGIVTAVIRSFT